MSKVYLPELREQLCATVAARYPSERSTEGLARRSRLRRRGGRSISGAVLAAAASAAIAFIAGAGSDPRATATDLRSDGVNLNDRFAVFGSPSEATAVHNPFASSARPALTDPMSAGEPMSINQDTVQRIALAEGDIWLGATDARVCGAFMPDDTGPTAVVCARPLDIISDGLFGSSSEPHEDAMPTSAQVRVFGLVPDGVDGVTFELADGITVDAAVHDNIVEAALSQRPKAVVFRDADNVRHFHAI